MRQKIYTMYIYMLILDRVNCRGTCLSTESAAESPQSSETVGIKDNGNIGLKFDKESIVNMILEDEIYGDLNQPKLQDYLGGEPGYAGFKSGEAPVSNAYVFQYPMNALAMQTMSSEGGAVTWGPPK